MGCVAQRKLKLIQREQRTFLADVIFLLSYKLPERFTSCVCISAPTADSALTHHTYIHLAIHLVTSCLQSEMGNLVCFTVDRVELSSSKSEFMQLCNFVLLVAKAVPLLCESHTEVSLIRVFFFLHITAASFYSVSL